MGSPACKLDEVGCAHRGRAVDDVRHGQCARVVDRRMAGLTLLGGHEDDTVGTAATVDGGCRGVLQNVDRLDVAGVQRLNAGSRHEGHTVDHVERLVALVERTLTADADRTELTRALVGGDVDTCCLALQGLEGVVHRTVVQLLFANVDHRACDVALLLRTITDDDHLVEQLTVFLQRDVDSRLAGHGHGLRRIADIRNDQTSIAGNPLNGVVTIEVGNGSVGSTFHHDAGTDDRLAAGVDHITCHFLGIGTRGTHAEKQQEHQSTKRTQSSP